MYNFPEMPPDEIKKCQNETYCEYYFYFTQIVYGDYIHTDMSFETLVLTLKDTISYFETVEEYEKCILLSDKLKYLLAMDDQRDREAA